VRDKFKINPRKYDYFFGRVGGNNVERSQQIARVLDKIGIQDTSDGRAKLEKLFERRVEGNEVGRIENEFGITVSRSVYESGVRFDIGYFYVDGDMEELPKITFFLLFLLIKLFFLKEKFGYHNYSKGVRW
jgi:hypothetical protein